MIDHQPLSLSSPGEGLATCQSQQSAFIPLARVQEGPLCVQLLGIALLPGRHGSRLNQSFFSSVSGSLDSCFPERKMARGHEVLDTQAELALLGMAL